MMALLGGAWAVSSKFLGDIWIKLAAVAAIVIGALFIMARLKQAGRDAERADTLASAANKQREMLNANAAGPRTSSDVDNRLRSGTF